MIRTLSILIVLFTVSVTYCQTVLVREHSLGFTIPEIAMVDIEPDNSSLNLSFIAPSEAGMPIIVSNTGANTKWVNYTSSISPFVSSRSIEVQVNNGAIPDGVEILLDVSSYSGGGGGVLGISSGTVTLSTAPQICIDNIGGCYTGNGSNNGHQLTYSIGITDYDALDANQSTVIEIMFTLVDN